MAVALTQRGALSLRFSPLLHSPRPLSRALLFRSFSSYLVTPAELASALKKNPPSKISTAPKTVPVCATWFLPNDGRNGLQTFREKRIPNARFFDLDKVIDKRSPYPHMLPSASDFAKAMSALGIRRDDTVVVYDSQELGIFSAPRVGWTLKAFGHNSVHVLNNFKVWVEEGYPTESGEFWDVDTCVYPIPEFDASKLVEFEEVVELAKNSNEGAEGVQILDARSKRRWSGKDPEPRPGLSSGHIPGSISMPMTELLDPVTKTILPADKLRKIFESKGIDPKRPIINSCGTGVTAAVIDAALSEAGYGESNRRLYDGSWTEWAQRVKPSENLIIKEEEEKKIENKQGLYPIYLRINAFQRLHLMDTLALCARSLLSVHGHENSNCAGSRLNPEYKQINRTLKCLSWSSHYVSRCELVLAMQVAVSFWMGLLSTPNIGLPPLALTKLCILNI